MNNEDAVSVEDLKDLCYVERLCDVLESSNLEGSIFLKGYMW